MRISLLIILLLGAATVNAAPMAKNSPAASPTPVPEVVKTWSADWSTKYQFSLHSNDDENKRASVVSTLAVNFLASSTFRIQGVIGGIQAIKPALDFRVINPEFRGFFSLNDKKDKLRFFIGPTLVLPFGSDAKDESLIFGAGVGGRSVLDLKNKDGIGFKGYYDLTFNKNFHQFETSIFAEVNNQLSLNHTLYLEYSFDSLWTLNTSLSFSSLWNYNGLLSDNYSFEQELDFQLSDVITLFASHVRGGDFLSPNGQNYSFGIFNADSSRINLGVVVSL